ncbi:hypothetical protein CMR01_09145 [Clostridium perfringens]|nr:hypothetical protein CMR01_09145 [Clostridium perfringens]PWW84217.1 hypothetical protein CYK87_10365 [Clostridium perfringens]
MKKNDIFLKFIDKSQLFIYEIICMRTELMVYCILCMRYTPPFKIRIYKARQKCLAHGRSPVGCAKGGSNPMPS